MLIDEEDDGEVATPGARAVGSIISETVYDIINREGISLRKLFLLCVRCASRGRNCVFVEDYCETRWTGGIENKYNYD